MTKKDYTKISLVFRARVDDVVQQAREADTSDIYHCQFIGGMRRATQALIIEMAKMLQEDNPRFDTGTFYVACGLDGAGAYRR